MLTPFIFTLYYLNLHFLFCSRINNVFGTFRIFFVLFLRSNVNSYRCLLKKSFIKRRLETLLTKYLFTYIYLNEYFLGQNICYHHFSLRECNVFLSTVRKNSVQNDFTGNSKHTGCLITLLILKYEQKDCKGYQLSQYQNQPIQ